jgi:hypothetical protein
VTFTSIRPITVDGVRLDTLGWNVEEIRIEASQSRSADATLPGLDGVVASLNDPREPGSIGLSMFVRGSDADGLVPTNSSDLLEANLDELVHLFSKRHAFIDYQRQVDVGGTLRRAWCKVTDAIAPDLTPGRLARFAVALQVPSGSLEDLATQDWTQVNPGNGTTRDVTTMTGSTETIPDSVVLVTGPVTNPKITDPNTGAYVQLNLALVAGDTWRVNVGTWSSRTALSGSPLTLASADTTGTDRAAVTTYGGIPGQVLYLPLTPVRSGGVRKVQIALSGTGITSGTAIAIRAKRRFRW